MKERFDMVFVMKKVKIDNKICMKGFELWTRYVPNFPKSLYYWEVSWQNFLAERNLMSILRQLLRKWRQLISFWLSKKFLKSIQVHKCKLNRRSWRYLRHIKVIVGFSLAVMFFSLRNRPCLEVSVFQVGITAHRVHLGVSGLVCKLWRSNPNKWSIKDLIPEKSPEKKYSAGSAIAC